YDGCEWTPEQMRDFFKEQGHFTTIPTAIPGYGGGKAIPNVLTMNGESANNPAINDAALNDPVSRAAIDVIGRHIYGDVQIRYANALDKEPKREVWMTEHNINSGNATAYPNDSLWNYVWQFLNDVDISIRLNDESAFIWWYLKRFYSVIGDGEYGTSESVVYPRGYGLSHYAKFSKEMWRVDVSVQGYAADGKTALSVGKNVNNSQFDRNSTAAKFTGFMSDDGNTYSVVMWTPTNTNGSGGLDMGTVKIQLPQGFVAKTATAMRSNANVKAKTEKVILSGDGTSAVIMLPRSNIVSVRFTK
ncbi:glycoside hydrolase, partial [Treponema sp. R80B11-R83G3]